jgi:hypothetical protein
MIEAKDIKLSEETNDCIYDAIEAQVFDLRMLAVSKLCKHIQQLIADAKNENRG